MADGTPTTNRSTTTWNDWTRTEALALRGDLACPECNGAGRVHDVRCTECEGRCVVLPRGMPEEAGADHLLDALTSLAETAAYADVVGLPLPERSQAFIEELRGLGPVLVEILERVEALQADVKQAIAAGVRR